MATLKDFPPELLGDIIQRAAPDANSLATCCLVCRLFNNIATPLLYACVDFCIPAIDEDEDEDGEEDENSGDDEQKEEDEGNNDEIKDDDKCKIKKACLTILQKQRVIISAIAQNARLEGFVHALYNNSRQENDATSDHLCDQPNLIAAGRNMLFLQRAHLEKSILGATIITSLEKYHNLTELSTCGFHPGLFVWAPKILNLRHLTWTTLLSIDDSDEGWPIEKGNQWETFSYLLNVVESTCPLLETLDLNFETTRQIYDHPDVESSYKSLAIVPERSILFITRTDKPPLIPKLPLDRLKHFGVRDDFGMVYQSRYRDLMQIKRTEKELGFILSMTEYMPELQEIALVQLEFSGWSSAVGAMDYLSLLTARISPPGNEIKRFTLSDAGTHFSLEMASLFEPWTGLKYLRLGDRDNSRGLYNLDGRLDLEGYNIATFIKELPSSLEELVLEINGEELLLEDDSHEFSKLCDQRPSIFKTLKHLRSCDIIFWISNLDGGLGSIPEKAIHWRRITHVDSQTRCISDKVKIICLSALECIYQEDLPAIEQSYTMIELYDRDDIFEGEDEGDNWWDKGTFVDRDLRGDEWVKRPESDVVYPRFGDLLYFPLYNKHHYINPYRPTSYFSKYLTFT